MRMLLASGGSFIDGMSDGTVAILVLITGLVIVFLMLIALILIIKLYGSIIYNLTQKNKSAPKAPVPAIAPAVQKVAMPEPAPAPVIEEGIPGEVIAAIAAAVYCAEGVSLSAVRSIRRVKSGSSRSAWGMAGVLDNTRPF